MGNKKRIWDLTGLPESFGVVLLTIAFMLALSPFLAGIKVGSLEIPQLPGGTAGVMKYVAPAVFLGLVALFLPVLRQSDAEPRTRSSEKTTRTAGGSHYRVIGFDLDGTLLRGLEYSWTLVWDYLGFPEAVGHAGTRRYLSNELSYQEWCSWAVQQFRAKGLKRSDFATMVGSISVTRNLREGIQILKADGFVLGIISGGIDTLLYQMIPDADELFDYVFINRLQFDDAGIVMGVAATEFDFDAKADGLQRMCVEHGYSIDQAVFVGEGFNDATAAARAGLSIAYPPSSQAIHAASNVQIEADDLLEILPYVLGSHGAA